MKPDRLAELIAMAAPQSHEDGADVAETPEPAYRRSERLTDALAGIEEDWARPLAPLRGVRPSIGGAPAAPRSRPPVGEVILDARHHVTARLTEWTWVLIHARPLRATAISRSDVPRLCRLNAAHADWWAHREFGTAMVEDICRAADRLHACAAPPDAAPRLRIGTCPLDDEHGTPCGGTVTADLEALTARCRRCHTAETVDYWRAVIALPQYATVRQFAYLAAVDGIPRGEGAIRRYIDRGIIDVIGTDQAGRRLVHRDTAMAQLRAHVEKHT